MIKNTILLICSMLIGFVACEAGYRAYVWWTLDQQLRARLTSADAPPATFEINNPNLFEFDRVSGFSLHPNAMAKRAFVVDGSLQRCDNITTNALGQMSDNRVSEDTNTLKIMVVGDSMTTYSWNNKNWPALFEQAFNASHTQKIDVINVARSGIGILQMFDIVANRMNELMPDIILFAFITDDIDRTRSWLKQRPHPNGGIDLVRVYGPDIAPTDPSARYVPRLISPELTDAWCENALGNRQDPTVIKMVEHFSALSRFNRAQIMKRTSYTGDVVFSFSSSMLWDRILKGDALYAARTPDSHQHKTGTPYSLDPQLARAIEAIKSSGIPFHLMHMPLAIEIAAQKQYIFGTKHQPEQLAELEHLTGKKVHSLYETMQNIDNATLAALPVSDDNQHPSSNGIGFYAEHVLEYFDNYVLNK